jgi:anti-sigma-K factor RskA
MIEQQHPQEPDSLEWLAFCYLTGEMTAHESAAFEERLAEDQSAREALARGVELVQSVAIAEARGTAAAVPLPLAHASWSRPLAWMSFGAVAALALAAAWLQFDRLTNGPAAPPSLPEGLAAAWSQTRDSVRDIVRVEPVADDGAESDLSMHEPLANDRLPSWIKEAVFHRPDGLDWDGDGKPDESWDDERLEN